MPAPSNPDAYGRRGRLAQRREVRTRLGVLHTLRADLEQLSAVPADSPAAAGLLLQSLAHVRTLVEVDEARLNLLDLELDYVR
jgi:hypothetical protein